MTGVAVWGSGCDWCCSVGVGRNQLWFNIGPSKKLDRYRQEPHEV